MARDALMAQMKTLKSKAQAARDEGKHDAAETFRRGAARLWRRVKRNHPKHHMRHAVNHAPKEQAPATAAE